MGVVMRYGSGGTNSGRSAGGSGGGVTMTKLWTNLSPTASFSAQNVSVDLSSYDYYAVQLRFSTSYDYRTEIRIFPVNEETNNLDTPQIAQNRTAGRHCTYNATNKELAFDGATYNGSSNNAYAIPLYIWGIAL